MGMFELKLCAGEEVAEKVDRFTERYPACFKSLKKTGLSGGAFLYGWYETWNEYRGPDHRRFVRMLETFDHYRLKSCAYKMLVLGGFNALEEFSNEKGDEIFEGLCVKIHVPEETGAEDGERNENLLWDTLLARFGHPVEIAVYAGPDGEAQSVTLEDMETNELILDAGIYTLAARKDPS